MNRRTFMIPTILAAGFGPQHPAVAAMLNATTTGSRDSSVGTLMRVFNQDHLVTLADHRSHSSHASHASHSSGYGGGGHYSHTSHRSGAGGYDGSYGSVPLYTPPSPTPTPTPSGGTPPASAQPLFTSTNRASAPRGDGLPALSGRTTRFAAIVRRVQLALLAQDFYTGPVNGVVAPTLRSALRKFQKARSLEQTGTITPQTLDALMVSSE